MGLSRQMVNLVRFRELDDSPQPRCVGQFPVVEKEPHVFFMSIDVQMIDPFRIKRRGSPRDAVNDVPLGEKELREIRSVLASDTRNQSPLGHVYSPGGFPAVGN